MIFKVQWSTLRKGFNEKGTLQDVSLLRDSLNLFIGRAGNIEMWCWDVLSNQ